MIRMQIVLMLFALVAPGVAVAQAAPRPATMEQCYLDVAARKGDADAVHLARELCDEVFRRGPRVSFHCQLRSNRLLMHIGFLLGGERGHNRVYQSILAALQARCEQASS